MLFQHGHRCAHILGKVIFLHTCIEPFGGVGVSKGIWRSHPTICTVRHPGHLEQREEALLERVDRPAIGVTKHETGSGHVIM